MEKISLYDPERDVIVDVMLSPEDISRAHKDVAFATSLLNAAVKERDITNNRIESVPIQQTTLDEPNTSEPMVHTSAYTETNIETANDNDDNNSIYRWSTAAVLLLLETYKSLEEKLSSGKYSHKKTWDEISAVLAEKGYCITGPQCAAKLRSLKKTYKSVKDHNNRSGNDKRTWQFYEVMDEIFSKKAWCSPVAVASSTGLSVKQINKSSEEFIGTESTSDSSQENSLKRKRLSKENMCSLVKAKLLQKTEQEEAKMKRHKERMEMDERFLSVLTKLMEK